MTHSKISMKLILSGSKERKEGGFAFVIKILTNVLQFSLNSQLLLFFHFHIQDLIIKQIQHTSFFLITQMEKQDLLFDFQAFTLNLPQGSRKLEKVITFLFSAFFPYPEISVGFCHCTFRLKMKKAIRRNTAYSLGSPLPYLSAAFGLNSRSPISAFCHSFQGCLCIIALAWGNF